MSVSGFYVLRLPSLRRNRQIYIGYSADLKKRIAEHKRKHSYWTKRLRNPKLIYYEAYESELYAKIRERKLKVRGSSYQGLIKRLGLK